MAAFFYDDDIVTAALPIDPELERWLTGNLSYGDGRTAPVDGARSPANRTTHGSTRPLYTGEPAVGGGGPLTGAEPGRRAWLRASQGLLYYAFPVEIGAGLVGGLLALAALTRQRKTSTDGYLIGFTIASVLLLGCGGGLRLPDYAPHSDVYQRAYGCIKSANDWLWYSALWILVVMSLERGLSLIENRRRTFCSAGQASAVVVTIFAVCLVSALPEFWEYESIETFDYVGNRTIVVAHLSETADSPEYRILYFWYAVTITVFLPYPVIVVMTVVLAQGMKRSRHSKRRLLQQKHASSAPLPTTTAAVSVPMPSSSSSTKNGANSLSRRISEDLHLTRLYIVMILLYVLLTAPLTFLIIVNGITPYWTWPVDDLYNGLYLIFEFVFYFYFSIQLPLYLSYYDKFRHSFVHLFRCCCRRRPSRHKHDQEPAGLRKQFETEDFFYNR